MYVITFSSPMLLTFAGGYGAVLIQTCGGTALMENNIANFTINVKQ
jgi:hypothetical protein